jgi:type I restriction enzyme S subunit
MGTFTTTSDVDLALFGDELTLTDQARLAAAIDNLPMAQQVDLLLYKSIDNDKLKQHIKKHGKEWFRRGRVMSADWPLVELSELVKDLTVGFVGSMTQEYVEKGVPFFRSKNIKPYDLEWADIKYVSRQFHEKLKKSSLAPGDVVIVRTGTPGTACVIPESVEEANCSDVVIARVNDKKLSAYYLSYFMNSVAVHQVSSHLVGAVQQHFNVGSAKKIKIPLPSRDEQEEIVTVLKTLDDKLKLNRQINQTLEEMAQAIFKSWFVDFEPVKAKANGQNPERAAMCAISGKTDAQLDNLPPDHLNQLRNTAALFPDELTDSELGPIPKGWEVERMKKLAEIITKGTTPRKPDVLKAVDPAIIPFIKVKDITDSGEILRASLETIPESIHKKALKRSILKTNDLLFSIAGTIGRVSLVEKALHNSNTNQAVAFIRLKDIENHLWLSLQTLKSRRIQDEIASKVVQGVQANASLANIGDIKVLVPSKNLLAAWNKVIAPINSQKIGLSQQIRHLAQLRDTLLPKLLSGEISVGSAQSTIEEAV